MRLPWQKKPWFQTKGEVWRAVASTIAAVCALTVLLLKTGVV
jgi:hypothetical protein